MEQQVKSWENLRAEGWRKSTFSSGNGGNCIMAKSIPAGIAVGDTKNPEGGTLRFTAAHWTQFTNSLKHER